MSIASARLRGGYFQRGHRSRDPHGRGMRGRLVPASAPGFKTTTQLFDELVLSAIENLESQLGRSLAELEFAVEEVPGSLNVYDNDVLEDGTVPLARLLDGRQAGRTTIRPRVVLYRRPLEARAPDPAALAELVNAVVTDQVAKFLGINPEDL